MPRSFVLPDLGEGLTEAEIVQVLVAPGQVVREDDPLLEVETDKARVEIPSPFSGRVERVHVRPGETVHVGAALVTFADAEPANADTRPAGATTKPAGATTKPAGAAAKPAGAATGPPAGVTPRRESAGQPPPSVPTRLAARPDHGTRATAASPPAARPPGPVSDDGRTAAAARTGPIPATPATRRLARELGVDLGTVAGSGPGGRVTAEDVTAAAPERAAPVGERPGEARPLARVGIEPPPLPRFEQWGPVERVPLSHLRRTIAERMTLSATLIPHVTHFDRADITDLDALIRRSLDAARERGITLTLTSFLLKAAALALGEYPQFNASLDAAAGELIHKRYHHLGVAVATERGLIVPVIRHVDQKPVLELARELVDLAQRVRAGKATLDDLRGGTFTVTNIGALGGTAAIPIINYPEVAILGVARAREEPVVRSGQIVPRLSLPLTLTFDHRVADGADGARFAQAIVRRLEAPEQLLWDW
jgi:pyruvate dehydrogenase E2 component (dihydrolipoamide acetyltransferase)